MTVSGSRSRADRLAGSHEVRGAARVEVHPARRVGDDARFREVDLEQRADAALRLARGAVEDEVAEAIGDELAAVGLLGLHDVRVRADDEIGARVDEAVRELALRAGRRHEVFHAPMIEDDDDAPRMLLGFDVAIGLLPIDLVIAEERDLDALHRSQERRRRGAGRGGADAPEVARVEARGHVVEGMQPEVERVVVRDRDGAEAGRLERADRRERRAERDRFSSCPMSDTTHSGVADREVRAMKLALDGAKREARLAARGWRRRRRARATHPRRTRRARRSARARQTLTQTSPARTRA